MSRLGRKMILIICGLVIAISAILVITSLVLTRNYSDNLMAMLTDIGVKVLKNDIQSQMDRIENFAIDWHNDETDFYAIATGDFSIVEQTWAEDKQNINDYGALIDRNGNVVWHTDNYNLTGVDMDVSRAMNGETIIGMAIDDNVPLSIQYIGPSGSGSSINGVVVIGLDLTLGSSLVDGVKTQTGSEVTLFGGKTRLVTTVTNSDGSRAVGTNMTEAVEQAVLNRGETYIGQADILGQNHFVHYEPIVCIHGDVIGAYFAGYSSAESDAMMAQVIIVSVVIAVIAMVIIAVLMVTVIRTLVEKPLKELDVIADDMSRGNLSVPDSSFKFANDEMGDFAHRLEETKHNLNSYISDMSAILSQMADGNFGASPNVTYAGDFVKIKESFKVITETLSDVIRNINIAAEDVTAGAGQMADGTQTLADGTITQASAIDELTSTVEDISVQVGRSAENSARANEMCKRSADKIEQQNEDISRMMSAMEDIKAKSNQISNIIQAIDDIAFQTNILALNAAVEAARAGEAGKGFAVVADEVRNLAAKSAEAANNTTSLISATISSVTDGAQIAEATAATMKEVIDISNSTNALIAEISAAAVQQAQSIQQVTKGLEDISTVVQQNSATAEESAASCEELSSQSQILKQQVSKLRV